MLESMAEYAQRPLVISRIVVIAVVVPAHSVIPFTLYTNSSAGMLQTTSDLGRRGRRVLSKCRSLASSFKMEYT